MDEFRRTGAFQVRTSLRAVAGIVACTLPFVGMFAYSFTSPNPSMPVAIGAVFAGPVLGVAIWIAWLLIPRVRVVADRDGLTVRGRRVAWAEISEFRIGIAQSRATYTYVIAERTHPDGQPAPAVSLPLLLSPQARTLKTALDLLLNEHHANTRGLPGRIQRWPNQP